MNPPFEQLDGDMYKELRQDIREHTAETTKGFSELRAAVDRVDTALDQHVHDEMIQYAVVQQKLARLETRWGILAAAASIIGAGIMAALNKVFF